MRNGERDEKFVHYIRRSAEGCRKYAAAAASVPERTKADNVAIHLQALADVIADDRASEAAVGEATSDLIREAAPDV